MRMPRTLVSTVADAVVVARVPVEADVILRAECPWRLTHSLCVWAVEADIAQGEVPTEMYEEKLSRSMALGMKQ